MAAHVTVLAPFRHASVLDPAAVAALAELFAAHETFAFELTATERFDDGTVYLAPVPAQPFVALTEAVAARFPEHPPCGGAFETIVPHLTVGRDVDGRLADAVRWLPLPIHAEANSVALVERGDDLRWYERCSFPLAIRT